MFQLLRRRRPLLSAAAVVFAVLYATELAAQTPFVPYFGKNRIRYDNFQWHIYTTDHFEIYYYPELEQHLERVAGYAESAYQHVSTELKHDLGAKVPLVLFKTQAEFQQQNVDPVGGAGRRRRLRRAEPRPHGAADRRAARSALSADHPRAHPHLRVRHHPARPGPARHPAVGGRRPGRLHGRRLEPDRPDDGARRRGRRHRAEDDRASRATAASATRAWSTTSVTPASSSSSRSGARKASAQYIFSLRKTVIGGGTTPFEEAFRIKADEFDQQFEKYLKDRFKLFRDQERPVDYGRNLAPDPRKTKFIEPALDRAVAVGRPLRRRLGQPQGSGDGHRPHLGQGRLGRSAT